MVLGDASKLTSQHSIDRGSEFVALLRNRYQLFCGILLVKGLNLSMRSTVDLYPTVDVHTRSLITTSQGCNKALAI